LTLNIPDTLISFEVVLNGNANSSGFSLILSNPPGVPQRNGSLDSGDQPRPVRGGVHMVLGGDHRHTAD